MNDNISTIVAWSQMTNLVMGIVGACAVFGILRFLAWINGQKHTDDLRILRQDAKALAIYKGAVFLACALFVALVLK